MRELQKIFPGLGPELTAQARLNFFPDRQSASELGYAGAGQAEPAFSPVFATARCDPASAAHDGERAGEACAVHGEHFAQLSLGHLAGKREHLQDSELRGAQPKRPERLLVELGQRP